jgi:excisionase family DNA binding protein
MTTKVLLTVEETAEALGYGRTYMFKLVREGEIESVKSGKLRRIPAAAIDEYVARLRTEQARAAV